MKAALLLALAFGASAPSFAADAPPPENRFAASIVPAERFETAACWANATAAAARR